MLLFSGDFGCVLYTGDFRWEADCEKARIAKDMLTAALNTHGGDGVDVVYLDNTYANPTYDFPTRSVATQQVQCISVFLPSSEHSREPFCDLYVLVFLYRDFVMMMLGFRN